MKRIKLKVLGISYSQTQSGAYALVLTEESGERRIPIIIGGFEAQAIVVKLENLNPPRPLTHDLFKSFADEFGITVSEVFISRLEDGVFYSQLICNNGEKEFSIDSRTSDAVALSLRFNCPIYITDEILDKAGIVINPEGPDVPGMEDDLLTEPKESEYESVTDDELYKLLDEAIRTEDYERAAAHRDELEKRKKKSK